MIDQKKSKAKRKRLPKGQRTHLRRSKQEARKTGPIPTIPHNSPAPHLRSEG